MREKTRFSANKSPGNEAILEMQPSCLSADNNALWYLLIRALLSYAGWSEDRGKIIIIATSLATGDSRRQSFDPGLPTLVKPTLSYFTEKQVEEQFYCRS